MNRMGRFGRFGDANVQGGNMPAAGGPGVAPGAGVGQMPEDEYGPFHKNVKFWFTYQTPNIASLAAAGTTTNSITFDNDSAFLWTKIMVAVDITSGAAQTLSTIIIPLVTLQIQDTGQGAYYSNAQIPIGYLSQPGLPYVMPAPQVIAPNATLQFNWTNYSSATTYTNLRIQLNGWKIRR